MKPSEIKDGMVLTERSGSKLLVFDENLYIQNEREGLTLYSRDFYYEFDNDFKDVDKVDSYDIVKVEYMGEVLWEEIKYVSFMEAIECGEVVKHKDWMGEYTLETLLEILSNNQKRGCD